MKPGKPTPPHSIQPAPPHPGTKQLGAVLDAPVFFGVAQGYVGGKTRDFDNRHVGELDALVTDFAVPASIFAAMVQASRAELLSEFPLAALLSGSMLALFAATYAMARRVYGFVTLSAAIYLTSGIGVLNEPGPDKLGLKGKMCIHWAVNPHPTLTPAKLTHRLVRPAGRL